MNTLHTQTQKIGLIGFGSLGKQIKLFISEHEKSKAVDWFFFDDTQPPTKLDNNIYPFSHYDKDKFSDLVFYIGIGYHHLPTRLEIINHLKTLGRNVGTFIHQTAYVHSTATIGSGVLIYPGCVVDQDVHIGDGSILNNAVVISHGSQIGAATFLAPRVTLCGEARVGDFSFLGAGTLVSNGISIGKNVRVGIGSVITSPVRDGESVIGNPTRKLNKPLEIS
jgi:sugar O-acyltransferase (sialic acid O-acetyltransferase NeuD family)